MKLASVCAAGSDRLVVLVEGRLVDLASFTHCPPDMISLIEHRHLDRVAADLAAADPASLISFDPVDVTWHPPVRRPCQVVCVALNNSSLDKIKVRAPTDHPAFFLKPFTALTGHQQPIRLRPEYGFTHPEPELAVIVGQTLTDATPEEALAAVFGYSIINDITCTQMREEDSFTLKIDRPQPDGSHREDLHHTSYPGRYKGADTFAPLGPYITTANEVPDPAALTIRCHMDGRLVASDHTANYVWSVANALSHISRTNTLLPGDVVAMGTAVGSESADPNAPNLPGITRCNLHCYSGDVTIAISGLGTLNNPVHMVR